MLWIGQIEIKCRPRLNCKSPKQASSDQKEVRELSLTSKQFVNFGIIYDNAQMLVREFCRHAAFGRPFEKSKAHEVWFVDIRDSVFFFARGRGQGIDARGAALEFFDQSYEDGAVIAVKAQRIHFQHVQCGVCKLWSDNAVSFN